MSKNAKPNGDFLWILDITYPKVDDFHHSSITIFICLSTIKKTHSSVKKILCKNTNLNPFWQNRRPKTVVEFALHTGKIYLS